MIPTIRLPVSSHLGLLLYTVGSNKWPEFEIIIEDESEYNLDISEDNTLALMPPKWSDEINSLSKNFQVLTCFH